MKVQNSPVLSDFNSKAKQIEISPNRSLYQVISRNTRTLINVVFNPLKSGCNFYRIPTLYVHVRVRTEDVSSSAHMYHAHQLGGTSYVIGCNGF